MYRLIQYRISRHYKAPRLYDETVAPLHEDKMTISNLFRKTRAEISGGQRGVYGPPKRRPMTEAVAEEFLWKLVHTDLFDHLFHAAGFRVDGLEFGQPSERLPSVFSQGRLPRLIHDRFFVRSISQELDPGMNNRRIRFCGIDNNDSITVWLCKIDEIWVPVGVRVIFLGALRTKDNTLITDYLVVTPKV